MCPKCREDLQTEVIRTGQKREAYCANCSHNWNHEDHICSCGTVPVPHLHPSLTGDPLFPICPRCGKAAQISKPA